MSKKRPRYDRRPTRPQEVAPDVVTGDVDALRSRLPWVRLSALGRVERAGLHMPDPVLLPLLIDALRSWWTRAPARRVLAGVLQGVEPVHDAILGPRERTCLRRAVESAMPVSHADFVIAAVGALARIGDAESRHAVNVLLEGAVPARDSRSTALGALDATAFAHTPVKAHDTLSRVSAAAQACLRELDQVELEASRRGTLVTPAAASDDTLLRPAPPGSVEDSTTLGRPASPVHGGREAP